MSVTQEQLEGLKKEIPYKWKIQSAKEWGCDCVAYIDARAVMDILDEVLGSANWQDHYREVAGQVYCDLSIKVGDEWVRKSDCGTSSQFEAEKGQASDAFKRAAVKWGVGRFLYSLTIVKLKSMEAGKDNRGNPKYVPCDDRGKRIYNLTAYINGLNQSQSKVQKQAPKPNKDRMLPTQRARLKELCGYLGWNGLMLNDYLKSYKMAWNTLTEAQADEITGYLEVLKQEHDEAAQDAIA